MSEVKSGSDLSELQPSLTKIGPDASVNLNPENSKSDPQTGSNQYTPLQSFSALLSNPSFEIPIEANFVVGIEFNENLLALIDEVNLSSQDGIIEPNTYDVGTTRRELNNLLTNNKSLGFIFANKVTIPAEKLGNARVGVSDIETTGILLPLPILKNRTAISTLVIDILETNRSFLDSFIRPWIIATSLYGLYKRTSQSKQNVKLPYLTISQFDRQRAIRKAFTFYNVVPVSLGDSTLSYTLNSDKKIISTNWLFETYSVTSY